MKWKYFNVKRNEVFTQNTICYSLKYKKWIELYEYNLRFVFIRKYLKIFWKNLKKMRTFFTNIQRCQISNFRFALYLSKVENWPISNESAEIGSSSLCNRDQVNFHIFFFTINSSPFHANGTNLENFNGPKITRKIIKCQRIQPHSF